MHLFAPILLGQKNSKFQSQNVTRENLRKAISYKKFARKMLMKLTTGKLATGEVVGIAVTLKP